MNTDPTYIDTPDALAALCERLHQQEIVAMDMESNGFFRYPEYICLIQIGIPGEDLVVDPIAIEDISPLLDVFTNPDVRILVHNGAYDVLSFKRDHGCQIANLYDTAIGAAFLGQTKLGLDNVLSNTLNIDLPKDKKLQRSDWTRRPLTPEQLAYGKADVAHLIDLYHHQVKALMENERIDWVLEENQLASEQTYNAPPSPDKAFVKAKGVSKLSDQQRAVFQLLYVYREAQAREADLPPFKIMPNDLILGLAEHATAFNAGKWRGSKIPRKHLDQVKSLVAAGLEADPIPFVPVIPPAKLLNQAEVKLLKRLKRWRERTAEEMDLSAPLIFPMPALEKLVKCKSEADVQSILDTPPVRTWQRQLFTQQIVKQTLQA